MLIRISVYQVYDVPYNRFGVRFVALQARFRKMRFSYVPLPYKACVILTIWPEIS